MDPHAYCQQRAAASGSSFYYSFVFLPPETRQAITAFYALCRELDDTVDEATERGVAQVRLNWWREEIGRFAEGKPTHPVTRALADTPRGRSITRDRLDEIAAGMAMDLDLDRYCDFAQLQTYCHRVAGIVGEVAATLFTPAEMPMDPAVVRYAHTLGLALQLTNIIRDVGEDARRGRIYLPQDELARFGIRDSDLLARRRPPGFRALMDFQSARADAFYDEALAILPAAHRRTQRAGLIMAAIYRRLLHEIRRADYPVLESRIALTPLRKLGIAARIWLFP